MRIEYEKYSTLMSVVNEMFHSKHIGVYEVDKQRTPEGRRVTFGVNWAGMGTLSPDTARDFAKNLDDAAEIAELLNHMDIVYYFDEDEEEQDWDALGEKIANAVATLSRLDLVEALS